MPSSHVLPQPIMADNEGHLAIYAEVPSSSAAVRLPALADPAPPGMSSRYSGAPRAGGLQLFQNGPTAVRQVIERGIMFFTRPQTQAGPRAAVWIPSASQVPASDPSGPASAGSNDRAEAGPGHGLLAGHLEMIT